MDGQGNFGSIDGDPPAAQRYTEARLTRLGASMMEDIEKDTVDYQPTYDDSSVEPTVLPTVLPNLLVNGAAGIAVGMATNIPPHNLGEVVDGLTFLLENQDLTPDERLEGVIARIPGPDFPTAGFIMGREGIQQAYRTGRGSIVMRARSEIETRKGDRESIVITEIPYQVNKARLIEKIAELARDERIKGIQDVRDESDRQGMRIVVDVKRGEPAQVILNNLYKHTPLQDTFGTIFLAIVDQRPRVLNLLEACELFLDFRRDVVRRRTRLRAPQGRGPGPRPRGLRDRPRPPRRGDRPHPRLEDAGGGEGRPRRPLRPHRDPGRGDPQAPAAAADRPRAAEDRRRAGGAAGPHRRPQGHPGLPEADRRDHRRRAEGAPGRARRPAAHRDRGRGHRDRGGGPDRGRGRGDLDHPLRVHQAQLDHQLPRAEARAAAGGWG